MVAYFLLKNVDYAIPPTLFIRLIANRSIYRGKQDILLCSFSAVVYTISLLCIIIHKTVILETVFASKNSSGNEDYGWDYGV